MNQDIMKKIDAAWWLWGILSCVFALCLPWIGWYAIGNIAVVGCGAYVMHLAKKRRKRIDENKDLIKKMTKNQKKKMAQMDEQEGRSILTLAGRLMPFVIIFCGLINIYTFVWSMTGHPTVPVFSGLEHMPLFTGWLLLSLDLLFLILFWIAFNGRVQEIMD